MTVRFYKLDEEATEYTEVAMVEDGNIVEGEDALPPLHPEELNDEERLLEHYDGPYLVAGTEDEKINRGYLITEPRRGVVGKYDGENFEYKGSSNAVRKFLAMGDPSGLKMTKASLVPRTRRETTLTKQAEDKWIPYEGPQGGEGWQHVGSGEVRYQQDPPGEVAEGYEEDYWKQNWPELEDTEWNEDLPPFSEMKEGDSVLFVNRNGESEVSEIVGYGFVRSEDWDHAKIGVELRDGREVLEEDIAAYAPTAGVLQPPKLEGETWEKAPGYWGKYNESELVHFRGEGDESYVGIVEGFSRDRGAVKVQTNESFEIVDPKKILHRASVDERFNRGYAILDGPFDDVPRVKHHVQSPDPEIVSEYGATVEDVRDAFGSTFGSHLLGSIEGQMDSSRYDKDDPQDWIRAITERYDSDERKAWADFKWELRGQANGVGMERVRRIIDEALGFDVSDPRHEIRDRMKREYTNNPEEWLRAAADFAIEDDWASIQKLQDAVNDWSGTVPFGTSGLHGHDKEADEIIPLSETGENAGISAGAMFVAEWDDGGRAYITRIRDEHERGVVHSSFIESSVEAERAMTGYNVQKALNDENETVHYPEHEYRFDEYLSVDSAPDDAVMVSNYASEKSVDDVDLPDGKPKNEIVETVGADVDDVQAAIADTLQPSWVDDVRDKIEKDPNMDVENPADWVAGAKGTYNTDRARVWNKFVEKMAEEAFETSVDRDDFMDMAASTIIAGNRDLHSKNVMVDDDGHLYPIDLDFSGYDLTEDLYLKQAVSKLVSTAEELGIEHSEEFDHVSVSRLASDAKGPLGQEILEHVENFASEKDEDEVLSANPMFAAGQMGDNVQRNFRAAKEGELEI